MEYVRKGRFSIRGRTNEEEEAPKLLKKQMLGKQSEKGAVEEDFRISREKEWDKADNWLETSERKLNGTVLPRPSAFCTTDIDDWIRSCCTVH